MKPGQTACSCGKAYYASQRWIHEKCAPFSQDTSRVTSQKVVVDAVSNVSNPVVDTAREREAAVVDARGRDRHRKTAERREYLRLAQRRSRAARRNQAGAA